MRLQVLVIALVDVRVVDDRLAVEDRTKMASFIPGRMYTRVRAY